MQISRFKYSPQDSLVGKQIKFSNLHNLKFSLHRIIGKKHLVFKVLSLTDIPFEINVEKWKNMCNKCVIMKQRYPPFDKRAKVWVFTFQPIFIIEKKLIFSWMVWIIIHTDWPKCVKKFGNVCVSWHPVLYSK